MAGWRPAHMLRRIGYAAGVGALAVSLAAADPPPLAVLSPPALAGAAARLRAFDTTRIIRVLAAAGLDMPEGVRVALVPEDDPRAERVPRWTVGRAWGDADIEIFPARVSGYPSDSLESVLGHEIVHLALDRRAGGRVLPRWFHEGVAEALGSDRGLSGRWQLLRAAAVQPTLARVAARLSSGREAETADAYRLAAALIDDLRRRHGDAVLGAIAAGVASGRPFDRAFVEATGETADGAAARAWSVYRQASQWLAVLSSGPFLWAAILLLACVALGVRLHRRALLRRRWAELDGES
jgi:hypothetical protein